jgi:hypothetical protein
MTLRGVAGLASVTIAICLRAQRSILSARRAAG